MLAALIECKPVARRRPRQNENVAELHVYSYSYEVNVVRDAAAVPIQFCTKALVSVFGITESRVKRIRSSVGKEDRSGKYFSSQRFIIKRIFTCKVNIAFGYHRKDTCSSCDRVNVDIQAASPEQLGNLVQQKELHLRKAQVFYDCKRVAKQMA
ncbi:hypothetical protein RRG08_026736 [Elysia crispata]|uniref:Uncharacterized protein n=1 Tax=Elysia crispata TaxID=231223 RepID=A0AAE1ASA3_9GAST|nr:hypothetical protein RRG08_026736 [Elysia crispata]